MRKELNAREKMELNKFMAYIYSQEEINMIDDPLFQLIKPFTFNEYISLYGTNERLENIKFRNFTDVETFFASKRSKKLSVLAVVTLMNRDGKYGISFEDGKLSDLAMATENNTPCKILYIIAPVSERISFQGVIYKYLLEKVYMNNIKEEKDDEVSKEKLQKSQLIRIK